MRNCKIYQIPSNCVEFHTSALCVNKGTLLLHRVVFELCYLLEVDCALLADVFRMPKYDIYKTLLANLGIQSTCEAVVSCALLGDKAYGNF